MKNILHTIYQYTNTYPSENTQAYIHITYAYAPPITNNVT